MTITAYKEWVRISKSLGGQATVMSTEWLLKGCPKCGCKTWQLTNDGWAYCDGCRKGYSLYSDIRINATLVHYDEYGQHCFMCKGTGIRDGETCDECYGKVTQPPKLFVPLFTKEGNTLFVAHDEFKADTEEGARQIGLGAMLVECILLDMRFEGNVQQLDVTNTPHRKAELAGWHVCIIGGPLLDSSTGGENATR